MPTPRIRAARVALIWLTAAMLILTAASFAYNAITLNRVNGYLCTWATTNRDAIHTEPVTPVRTTVADADERLIQQLGC